MKEIDKEKLKIRDCTTSTRILIIRFLMIIRELILECSYLIDCVLLAYRHFCYVAYLRARARVRVCVCLCGLTDVGLHHCSTICIYTVGKTISKRSRD